MTEEVTMQARSREASAAAKPTSARDVARGGPGGLRLKTEDGEDLTVAAGDPGGVVAEEDEQHDLEEVGQAVHEVPSC